jgi:membrane-associated phospholipid phosphatase
LTPFPADLRILAAMSVDPLRTMPLLGGIAESFGALERHIVHWVTCTLHTPFVNRVFLAAQDKVVAVPAMVGILVLSVWKRPRRTARALLTASAGWGIAMLIGQALWITVDRPRPQRVYTEILRTPEELATCESHPEALALRTPGSKSPSFPSLHGMTIGVFATTLWLLWAPLGWLASIWGAVAAVGRVYAGKHWPSDVLAGIVLGILVAWFTWWAVPRVLGRWGWDRWVADAPPDGSGTPG